MNVLLVDDDDHAVRANSRLLQVEQEHWNIETANSGAEALEILRDEDIDAVVSDLCMPGMDGIELLESVAQEFPQVLRVVLSGQASRDMLVKTLHPMHQYLAKPCDPNRLIQILQRAEILQKNDSLDRGHQRHRASQLVAGDP